MAKRRMFVRVLFAALFAWGAAGCGTLPSATAVPATAPPAAATVLPVSTPAADRTPTGTTASQGAAHVDMQVTWFRVALSYTSNPGGNTPPLVVTATVQLTAANNGSVNVQDVAATRIVVRRATGDVVLDSAVAGGVLDMKPLAGLSPGASRSYGYTSTTAADAAQLKAGDEVTGTLTVRLDGQDQQVPLPATQVGGARIP